MSYLVRNLNDRSSRDGAHNMNIHNYANEKMKKRLMSPMCHLLYSLTEAGYVVPSS